LSANSHTADKHVPEQVFWLSSDSQLTYSRHNTGGRSILVVSAQLRHHSCICTYGLVCMQPRKRQQVLDSWYSDDGGSTAHSGDDRALPCLLCLLHLEVCETLLHYRMHVVIKAKETAVMNSRETTLCING
jgi:hypothetical protein